MKLEERNGKGRETTHTHTHINLHFRIENYPTALRGVEREAFIEEKGEWKWKENVVDVHGEKS